MAYTACNGSGGKTAGPARRSATSAGCTWRRSMREIPFTCCCTVAINSMPMRYGRMFRHSPSGGDCPGVSVERLLSRPKWPRRAATSSSISYCHLWSQPELAPILSLCSIADDVGRPRHHRRLGQLRCGLAESPMFQGLWSAAREHFALFQLARPRDDLPEGFTDRRGDQFGWAYRMGEIGIVAPDLRSERTRERVMGKAGWSRPSTASLESMADCRHVLLLSSVPLVQPVPSCARAALWSHSRPPGTGRTT